MTECTTFKRLARSTWNLLDTSRSTGLQLGEETLTELNLLKLKRKHPRTIFIKSFTKPQEAIEGADWEWWFIANNGECVCFRVQAKVLNVFSQRYEHLHYYRGKISTGTVVYQCNTLIQQASNNAIPIYCLYSSWRRISPKQYWPCSCISYNRRLWGCSIIPAQIVQYLRHQGKLSGVRDLLPYLKPWHCLVCCEAHGGGSLPERICRYWNSVIDETKEIVNADIEWPKIVEPQSNTPEYVKTVMLGGSVEAADKNLAGVFILKETSNEKNQGQASTGCCPNHLITVLANRI